MDFSIMQMIGEKQVKSDERRGAMNGSTSPAAKLQHLARWPDPRRSQPITALDLGSSRYTWW